MAIDEGLQLALHWTNLGFVLETDCAEACDLIKESTPKSKYLCLCVLNKCFCELLRCKGTLPLSVFLVLITILYGLMFSLCLYEGMIHRSCLYSMCWIQV
jgi:hypothetical protein